MVTHMYVVYECSALTPHTRRISVHKIRRKQFNRAMLIHLACIIEPTAYSIPVPDLLRLLMQIKRVAIFQLEHLKHNIV